MLSVLDLFRIGIGPSSSHTVGPMRAAARFARQLTQDGLLERTDRVEVRLLGSLAFTGKGHATDRGVMLGLAGHAPDALDLHIARTYVDEVLSAGVLVLDGRHQIAFAPARDIIFDFETPPDLHPNALQFSAYAAHGDTLAAETVYSTGGGFIATATQLSRTEPDDMVRSGAAVPHPFGSAAELLALCAAHGLSIEAIVRANEEYMNGTAVLEAGLDRIALTMMECIDRGLETEGLLPGGLKVQRRAPALLHRLQSGRSDNERESLFDWLNLYAMAVNEENAAGGIVVTAPTNGAAGIIPAVIRHYCAEMPQSRAVMRRFLLVAGGIGLLYKQRASISGAEMGCQGEVGVACSMAAAGLAAVWGGSPAQIACAAEIGMEHNLGLTCDPVGGLVQVPCIERNAIGAVKAANAARLAMHGTGHAKVSLDQVIETMRQTGVDMSKKYKETSQGGLAVNVVEC